jgi:hypothetical protein
MMESIITKLSLQFLQPIVVLATNQRRRVMLFTDFSRVVFFKIYLSPLRMLQALVFFAEDIGDRLGGKDIINKTGDGSTDSSCSLYFLVQMYKLWLLLICGKRKLINQLLILAHCLLALLRIIYQLSVAWVR